MSTGGPGRGPPAATVGYGPISGPFHHVADLIGNPCGDDGVFVNIQYWRYADLAKALAVSAHFRAIERLLCFRGIIKMVVHDVEHVIARNI